MNDDERIRAYVRARADVPVPDDLQWPTAASAPRRRWTTPLAAGWGRVASAGLVLAVVAVVVAVSLGLPRSTPPASGPSPSAGPTLNASFPSQVAGLPVVTVAHAAELLRSGALDGQAVAVAGYFDEVFLPCPAPMQYIGPLEDWCRAIAFTDTRADAQLCHPEGSNGTACGKPSGTYLAPFFVSETSGDASTWLAGSGDQPVALVLIGHAGDARQWQCTAATQAACAGAFVVDRIAWAEGHDVPPAAPQTGDQQGKVITPRMTLAQVAAAIGPENELLTAAPFVANGVSTVDPRWNLTGTDLVWVARSLVPGAASTAETRPETVWLVDDATGRVMDSNPLQLAAGYQPARLWQMAIAHGANVPADEAAFYRVVSGGGTTVYEGPVSGFSSSGQGLTTYGGFVNDSAPVIGPAPLVLPAGGYSISAWLATYDSGVMGTPRGTCSTQVTLKPLDDLALNADFPSGQVCTFQPVPSPSPGS